MSGNKIGGAKVRQTLIDKYGEDHWKNLGRIGGKTKNSNKGFGSNRELARTAGKIGGSAKKKSED